MDSKNPKFISPKRYPIPFSLLILSFLRGIFFIIIFILVTTLPVSIVVLLGKLGLNNLFLNNLLLPPLLLPVLVIIFWIIGMIVYMKKVSEFEKRRPLESFFPHWIGGGWRYANFCLSPVRKWILRNIVCNRCKGQLKKANLVNTLDYINNPRLMRLHMFKVRCANCKKDFLLGTGGFFDKTLGWISDNK